MAYAALVNVSQTLDQILDFHPYLFPCSKEKVESFQETISSLIAFLDNCSPIRLQMVNGLMTRIRDSAYEAEDNFESLVATHFLKKYGSDSYEKFEVCPRSLEKVIEAIESIEKEVKKIQKDGVGAREQKISALASSSSPCLRGNNIKMAALDPDLEMKLMEELVGGESKIDVISIVGMGGIGKTTLARILYDSKLMKETFEVCGWATISHTYNAREIVLRILKDIGVPLEGKKDGEQHLYQSLYDRKYLIVLDDVWNTQAWDDLKRLFPDNNNGSRIILTTRHSKMAEYANSFSSYHEMKLLNESSSWRLLYQEIFLQKNCPPELVKIGKEIARQCQGLPLAIAAIGGHLKKENQTEEYWKYVSENLKSVLQTTNDMSLEILTLSYNYLPHHLKACFLYIGSFPEDHDPLDVSTIVKLWVAEGFVKSSGLNSMDEAAEEYLKDVIERNLVFVSKYDSLGKPKTCGIHDLFREICIREAKKENFVYVLNRDTPFDLVEINSKRRLILSPNFRVDDESPCSGIVSRDGNCSAAARSLFCLGNHQTSSLTFQLASGLLKVLSIRRQLSKFPVEILELVNLKYLQLGHVPEIPSSISRLRNLQTLIAFSIDMNSMPSEVWEMPRLRHLLIVGFHLPDVQDESTNAYILISLQTLSRIINFRCTQEVLARIPNLKKLNIAYDMDFRPFQNPLNNLADLCKLESLRCEFKFGPNFNMLRSLAFPCSLKKLVLVGSQIPWKRMTIIGILPNLEVLKLRDGATEGKIWETNDGEFKQLKFLLIRYSDLLEWKTERDHFPKLRHLTLEYCFYLESIPPEIGEIPTLETIELVLCSSELESSANEILGEDSDIKLISDENDCCIS